MILPTSKEKNKKKVLWKAKPETDAPSWMACFHQQTTSGKAQCRILLRERPPTFPSNKQFGKRLWFIHQESENLPSFGREAVLEYVKTQDFSKLLLAERKHYNHLNLKLGTQPRTNDYYTIQWSNGKITDVAVPPHTTAGSSCFCCSK